jgi:hypothetical protein
MKRFLLLILAASLQYCGVAFAQTTNYPSGLDTSASLFVTADNVQSSLSLAMAAGDTTAFVASTTGFVPNMIVTICDVVTSTGKCTTFEHLFVTAVPGANSLTVTRGFAGTSAVSHAKGKLITPLFDAAHQKTLKDAVIAIETALGTNLVNVPTLPNTTALQQYRKNAANAAVESFTPQAVYTADYNFTAQSPSGTIVAGNNSVTMAPVPLGVNGTDANHYLYVAGTGTPEACLITGGAGMSGQTSGAIILNCANTHSAGFTVASATAGIKEAMNAKPWSAVRLPCSAVHIQAGIVLAPTVGLDLGGCGRDPSHASGTVIINDDTTALVGAISLTGSGTQQQVWLHDFTVACNSARTCGTHLNVSNFLGLVAERLWLVESGAFGFHCYQCVGAVIRDNVITHTAQHGMFIEQMANQAEIVHNTITDSSWTDGYANLRVTGSAGHENLSILIANNDLETCGGNPAHAGVSTCYNLAIDNTFGARIIGANYLETAKPVTSLNFYCGTNSRNITFDGNRIQDGSVQFDSGCLDVDIGPNTWANFGSITTALSLTGTPASVNFRGRQTTEAGSGTVTFNVAAYGTASATAGAATLNAQSGTITSEALTTAAGSIYTLTLTDSMVAAASVVLATVQLGTSTQGTPQIVSVAPAGGSVVIKIKNIDGSNAFNGTIKVQFTVSNLV